MHNHQYNYYAQAVIHLNHLKANLKIIKKLIPQKNIKLLIPVKSNAYGFGLTEISHFLEKEKIDYLGVAFPFEGIHLRENKIKLPVLIFSECLYKADLENVIKYNLTPTVFNYSSLSRLNQLGARYKKICPIHINIDTGMSRNGISCQEALPFIDKALSMKNIHLEGLYTHLSSADEKNRQFTKTQIERFDDIITSLKNNKINIPLIHILNSAGIINYPEHAYTMIRPGIMFYGYFPDNRLLSHIKLKQGMSLQAKVIYIRYIQKKTPVSYAHTYISKNRETLATVSAGYGDGINRLLSNNYSVLYKDTSCPVRGRICMDQFMISINNIKNPKVNDWITIFGKGNKKEIRLENMARSLKTIPYELTCNIGTRVKRIYL